MNTMLFVQLALVGAALAAEPTEPAMPGVVAMPSKESVRGQTKGESKRDHVKAILESKIDLDFDMASLFDVLEAIRAKTGVNIVVDAKALEEAGVKLRETLVTIDVTAITVRAAMKLILREHDLTWLCREGEVVFVTTTAQAETILERRVYPVGDLLLVRENGVWPHTPYVPKVRADGSVAPYADVDDLIEMITSMVAQTTWAPVGGQGAIKYLPAAQALAIYQTHQVLEDIEALLAELREVRASQLAEFRQANPNELVLASYAMPRHAPTWRADAPALGAGSLQYEAELKTSLANAATTAKEFATVIPQVIEPASWKTAGGKGEIFVVNDRLVVRQTAAVQAQVAKLLSDNSPPMPARAPAGFGGSLMGNSGP